MNSYDLSRNWFNWCFENPEKIKPNHTALYFFIIEHCNRLGWKSKFGLPATMAKEAIGMSSYNTFISTFNDLADWGFIIIIERSKNQYSSNIIALSNFDKAPDKALDKALIKHGTKQSESTVQSIDSINKQVNKKQETKKQIYKNCLLSKIDIFDFPELNHEYFEIAYSFYELFKSNLIEAGASLTTIEKAKGCWIDDVRLMVEVDKISIQDFREIYAFLKNDAFWKQNILSIKKLREKYPQLKLKINGNKQQFTGNSQQRKGNKISEYYERRLLERMVGNAGNAQMQ